mgnify:CR=1 FL=1
MRTEFSKALERAGNLEELAREDLVTLISADDSDESQALFSLADSIRCRFMGDEVHFRGIVEFSNFCARNCLYCGLRKDNSALKRYRMTPQEIVESARRVAGLGCRTIVLQSGEDGFYTAKILADVIYRIKKEYDLAITVSVGERTRDDYAVFREAGADRYLLKHETSNPQLFADLRPGTSLKGRVERLGWLRELGYQIGSGNMVGLPGQTVETLADDIIIMRDMEVEMAGIGPFIPNGQTPLKDEKGGALGISLKTLAAARLALPRTHLAATTATGTIHPTGRALALKSGANVIMPNMTPSQYRENYLIYPGKTGITDTPEESYSRAVKTVESVGREISRDYGHSLRYRGKAM